MTSHVLAQLRSRTDSVRERWDALLRIERVNTPLANPDALVYLIPKAIADVFERLVAQNEEPEVIVPSLPACDCGNNPYKAFYLAGQQAFVEALILVQATSVRSEGDKQDLLELARALRLQAMADIDAFCGACQHRCKAPKCRHAPAATAQD